jgi:hypothetical protein
MTKIVVYELNEVPWRVVDRYLSSRPSAHLGKLLQTATQLTTRTTDSGELHPWSTWPTMHRGVNNDAHEIRFINQDLTVAQDYPPLWQLLVDSGTTVGICGCLQSFPPLAHQNMHFHIPDTFAPAPDTLPSRHQPFQKLNLKLTGENKAIATGVSFKDITEGLGLFRTGVTMKSGMRLAGHLVSEKINKLNKSLRATMQAHVAFDVFMDAMKSTQPEYAAFFSNHVAGTMHRYWKYAFPEDFDYQLRSDSEFDQFHSQSVFKAMDIFDEQLGVLLRFAETHGYDVVVCSSMGQEAVHRGAYSPELKLDDERLLAEKMGFVGSFEMKLAMQPDINFVFANYDELARFKNELFRLKDADGKQVLKARYEEQGLSLNLMSCRSTAAYENRTLLLDGQPIALEALGFSVFKRDQGTGYHQPEGSLIWKQHKQLGQPIQDRSVVDSRQYAPTILSAFGATVPSYMMEPIALQAQPALSPTARVA